MKTIPLTRGLVALVDDEDFLVLSQFKWCAFWSGSKWYAQRREHGTRRCIYMHRELLGVPTGVEVDHANRDGLDNRRSNLRPATRSQNNANTELRKTNTSGFKGVTYMKRDGTWRAVIRHLGRQVHIGYFHDRMSAARAYDAKLHEFYGEFACPNFAEEAS